MSRSRSSGPVARDRRQPRARTRRDAVAVPRAQRLLERVLGALLGEVPVGEHPDEGRDDAAPLVAERLRDGRFGRAGHSSRNGRTSMLP